MFVVQIIVAQLMVFGVIALLLRKVIFSDTNSALNRLNDSRTLTEKKNKELDNKMKEHETEYAKKIEATNKKADELLEQARKKMEEESKEALEKARAQAEGIIQKANVAKDKIREDIIKKMDVKIVSAADKIFRAMLPGAMPEKFNEYLADEFLKELKELDTQHIDESVKVIEVHSRYKLSSAIIDKIRQTLKEKLKRDIEVQEKTDETLIGGVALRFGTLSLDGSLKSKLQEASERIKREAEEGSDSK